MRQTGLHPARKNFFCSLHPIQPQTNTRCVGWMIGHAAVRGNYNIARIRTIIYLLKRLDHYLKSAFFLCLWPSSLFVNRRAVTVNVELPRLEGTILSIADLKDRRPLTSSK